MRWRPTRARTREVHWDVTGSSHSGAGLVLLLAVASAALQSPHSSHIHMTELRRSLRVMRREQDAFEPLADELVDVVLGMLDSKSLCGAVCCNRRLQKLAAESVCDYCAKTIPWGTGIMSCRECDFDVCPECMPIYP